MLDFFYGITARRRARRGARLLDEKVPRWRQNITRPVRIESAKDCILGQVGAGGFSNSLRWLFGDERKVGLVYAHGFVVAPGRAERAINKAWTEIVIEGA